MLFDCDLVAGGSIWAHCGIKNANFGEAGDCGSSMKRMADSSVRVMQWMSVFLDANEFEGMNEFEGYVRGVRVIR